MIQEIIVGLIGAIVILILIYKVYSFLFTDNKQNGGCGCSNCHCNTEKKTKKV